MNQTNTYKGNQNRAPITPIRSSWGLVMKTVHFLKRGGRKKWNQQRNLPRGLATELDYREYKRQLPALINAARPSNQSKPRTSRILCVKKDATRFGHQIIGHGLTVQGVKGVRAYVKQVKYNGYRIATNTRKGKVVLVS